MKEENKFRKVERPFLKEKKRSGFKIEEREKEELREYVLMLMKNNGQTDIIENVEAGKFLIKSESTQKEKVIMLTPNKLTSFKYNGQRFRGWVAHEDNMSPFPQEPTHNGRVLWDITQRLALNYKDVNEGTNLEKKTKMIITIFIGVILVIIVAYSLMKKGGFFEAKEVIQVTGNIAKEIISNNTVGVVVT